MARKILAVALVVIFGAALAGCATDGYYSPERSAGAGALGGAAGGAALGAIIGAATGNPATGAWIGAASGALVGAIGGYLYAEHKNHEAAASRAAQSYNPNQGSMVAVDRTAVYPKQASPGGQVTLAMNYTVMTPGNTATNATLYREVRRDGQLVTQPSQVSVTNYNGSYEDRLPYKLSKDAQPGTYTVTSRVSSDQGTAEQVSTFYVR
jgi:hypothetical protein